MSQPITLDSGNFDSEVLQSDVPVLVDFWAAWCGPCKAIAPTLDAIANDLGGSAKIAKLNVDDHPELAGQYGVQSIPTMVVFKNGVEVDRTIGVVPRAEIEAKLLAAAQA